LVSSPTKLELVKKPPIGKKPHLIFTCERHFPWGFCTMGFTPTFPSFNPQPTEPLQEKWPEEKLSYRNIKLSDPRSHPSTFFNNKFLKNQSPLGTRNLTFLFKYIQ
jgi:hypothetical protein